MNSIYETKNLNNKNHYENKNLKTQSLIILIMEIIYTTTSRGKTIDKSKSRKHNRNN
jgi:hypothetical protein